MSMVSRQSWSADDEVSIPHDLLIEILLRLPPERAVELRCLSKFCRGVIESDDFILKNYDRSIKTTPSFLLRRRPINSGGGNTEFLVDFDSTKSAVTVRKLTKPYIVDHDQEKGFTHEFVGCCRRILCYNMVKGRSTRLVFWNPFTRAYRRSLEHVDPINCPESANYMDSRTGSLLGYDSLTDDLKVLKIMQYPLEEDGDGDRVYVYAVYSSKTDSWKRVEGLKNKHYFGPGLGLYDNCDVFVEGTNCVHIICFAFVEGLRTRIILCFDFASEKFKIISVPKHWRNRHDSLGNDMYPRLSSLNGCLCIYHKCLSFKCLSFKPPPDYLDVWMMKQYGDEESWIHVFNLNHCGRSLNLIPLTFTSMTNGRQSLVLSSTLELRLYLCNIEEEEEQFKEALHVIQPCKSQSYDYNTQRYLFAASPRQP